MIKQRTVLILGAGASKPYGLPLGRELRDAVIRTSSALVLPFLLPAWGVSSDAYAAFTEDLKESGFPSVDAFLEVRPKWMDIGKTAMAICLLRSESQSREKLFPPKQPRDHWYETLWAKLNAPSWRAFCANPWHVITFNYDRSLEHYLVRVLCNNYRVSEHTVSRRLPILHVHGSMGGYTSLPLGGSGSLEAVNTAAKSIRVVHEGHGDRPEFRRAQSLIGRSDRVLFIGFGYHEQNMRRLGLPKVLATPEAPGVLGTHKGLRQREWQMICETYDFSSPALRSGSGSISEFLGEWLE